MDKTDKKVNRYTILDAEIKDISKALKDEKQKMLKTIKDAEAAYRKYRKEVYAPARKAAFDKFKAAKVVGQKKADKPAKVTKAKKNAAPKLKADEVIAKGEAAVAKAKAKAKVAA